MAASENEPNPGVTTAHGWSETPACCGAGVKLSALTCLHSHFAEGRWDATQVFGGTAVQQKKMFYYCLLIHFITPQWDSLNKIEMSPWMEDLVWSCLHVGGKGSQAMFFHCGQNTRDKSSSCLGDTAVLRNTTSALSFSPNYLPQRTTWLKDKFLLLLSMRRLWMFSRHTWVKTSPLDSGGKVKSSPKARLSTTEGLVLALWHCRSAVLSWLTN